MRFAVNPKELRYRDFVEKGYVIAGSPATVRQRLEEEVVKGLRVGNLMVLLQIGSMPHELTLQNMDLFAREVLPSLRPALGGRGLGQPLVAREAPQARPQPARRWRRGVRGLNGTQGTEHAVAVWQNQVRMRVLSKGSGPALVFFHGPWGLHWDPFLDALSQHFTVHAPEHPGTSPGAPDDIYHLDGLWDLILCYDELLEAMGLENAAFVGHSFGAMVACEMAAAYPRRVGPPGAHRSHRPLARRRPRPQLDDAEPRRSSPRHIFRDPASAGARRMFAEPEDEEARVMAQVGLTWAMGATGKFIWPIPDKGLKKRIHRVKAPTLLIWGADDRIVPPVYAEEFRRQIAGARVETVKGAGHAPHLEQPGAVAGLVRDFVRPCLGD